MATLIALGLLVPTAGACPNPIRLSGDAQVRQVRKAERALAYGDLARAVALTSAADYRFEGPVLARRARLISAVAALRRGDAGVVVGFQTMAPILAQLEALHAARPDAPLEQARLAEALVRGDPAAQARARALIEDLVARDLVPDAHVWLTAARVRIAAGDADGAAAALAMCRKRGKRYKVACEVPS